MNDFTDDSSVKFYLNRRTDDADDSTNGHEDDGTIKAESSFGEGDTPQKAQYLSSSTSGKLDRFTSPSIHFPLQVVIYAEDLPEDMQFHPTTEAIVYKYSFPDPTSPVVVAPSLRCKVFMLPKNVTVAEVTEIGLEKFGIQDALLMVVMRLRIRQRRGGVELGSGTV